MTGEAREMIVNHRAGPQAPRCRFCSMPLHEIFVDLGTQPLSNRFLRASDLNRMEPFYPLRAFVCERCLLVQLEEFETPEQIFGDYVYFSSYSDTWLRHCQAYAEMAVRRFALDGRSRVVEIASNDGYLLKHFVDRGIPALGVEPAANVAEVAIGRQIPTLVAFFGCETAREMVQSGWRADLVIGNNVLAHVPQLNDFAAGLEILLQPHGVVTMEFPHLMRLMEEGQFDTIYHEHFSYFSLHTVERIFAAHGMTIFDVDELPTHGGSLRIYVRRAGDDTRPVGPRLQEVKAREVAAGLTRLERYRAFGEQVRHAKRRILSFLVAEKDRGRSIVGYGAPAKGNTLLNYCGIRDDFVDYTVDRNPHKQGHFLPGTRIPVYHPDRIRETKPDLLLILPWNLKDEIMRQTAYIHEWGGQFATLIPEPRLYEAYGRAVE